MEKSRVNFLDLGLKFLLPTQLALSYELKKYFKKKIKFSKVRSPISYGPYVNIEISQIKFFAKISEHSPEQLLLISIIVYVLSEAELACEVRTAQRLKRASLTSVKTSKSKHVLTGSKHRAK